MWMVDRTCSDELGCTRNRRSSRHILVFFLSIFCEFCVRQSNTSRQFCGLLCSHPLALPPSLRSISPSSKEEDTAKKTHEMFIFDGLVDAKPTIGVLYHPVYRLPSVMGFHAVATLFVKKNGSICLCRLCIWAMASLDLRIAVHDLIELYIHSTNPKGRWFTTITQEQKTERIERKRKEPN